MEYRIFVVTRNGVRMFGSIDTVIQFLITYSDTLSPIEIWVASNIASIKVKIPLMEGKLAKLNEINDWLEEAIKQ